MQRPSDRSLVSFLRHLLSPLWPCRVDLSHRPSARRNQINQMAKGEKRIVLPRCSSTEYIRITTEMRRYVSVNTGNLSTTVEYRAILTFQHCVIIYLDREFYQFPSLDCVVVPGKFLYIKGVKNRYAKS